MAAARAVGGDGSSLDADEACVVADDMHERGMHTSPGIRAARGASGSPKAFAAPPTTSGAAGRLARPAERLCAAPANAVLAKLVAALALCAAGAKPCAAACAALWLGGACQARCADALGGGCGGCHAGGAGAG